MSLVLQEVSYTYPGTSHGLKDVSFCVETGSLVAVIGPSGSGKSTLLKLVSGLTTGHSGAILLNGQDLSGKPVHERHIGMVFQSYALFPHLNVLNNIAYGLKLRKVPQDKRDAKARELLDLMGLASYAESSVTQLSGGQQQRVALARALAIDPKALLLDEPLAALDASIRGYLRDQIRAIQKRFNATTLLVTHDQEEALTMADQVAVLKEGRLIQLAPPQEIYQNPVSKDVAEFVGLSSILPASVLSHDTVDLGFGLLRTPTGHRAIGQKVFVLMRPEHFNVDPPEGGLNILPGRTGNVRYLGAVYQYDFELPSGETLLVESPCIAKASLSIEPQDIRLLDF